MSPDRVLLVDDEEDFVETLAERMRARGLEVETAANGSVALRLAEDQMFDAVILDLAMPGMSGLETLQRLLELRPGIQVMLLSGRATIADAVEATRLGAVDVLEKPAPLDELLEHIRTARKRRLKEQERRSQEEIERIMLTRGW
jgi:DNA-binding NtrC family response regulator